MPDRSKYIGGSDAAKLIGRHQYEGPRQVYQMLLDGDDYKEKDLSDNRHIMRGNVCEPYAEARIKEDHPSLNEDKVFELFDSGSDTDQIALEHPDYDFIGGHTDGISLDPLESVVVVHEIKAPASSSVEYYLKNGIPSRYFYQLQHYMGIVDRRTELDVEGRIQIWDCDEWDTHTIDVEYRPKYFDRLEEIYVEVWEAAQEGVPFEETNLPRYEYNPDVISTPYLTGLLTEYWGVHQDFKEAKERKKELKSTILSQLDGEERIEGGDFYARVKYYDNSTHLIVREKN